MVLKAPQDLLRDLDATITKMRGGTHLSAAERRHVADDLAEVFNYVSVSSRRPSFTNTLYAASARDARLKQQLDQERATLGEHRQFIEQNFDKAEQYLRTVQLGWYTVFFAVWGFARESFDPAWAILAVVLMMISAIVFIGWEVWKSTLLTLAMKHHVSISSGGLEKFLRSRMSKLIQKSSSVQSLTKVRAYVWLVCVSTAVPSAGIMLWQLLCAFSVEFTSS